MSRAWLVALGAVTLAVAGSTSIASEEGSASFARSTGRIIVHKRAPRVSLIVSPAWYLEYGTLHVDNNKVERFPSFRPGMSIWFLEPTRRAWDGRAGRAVPFPRNLIKLIASSPYVRILGSRTVRLDGLPSAQIDVVARRGDPKGREANLCGELGLRDRPCVPITAGSDEEGFTSLYLRAATSSIPAVPRRLIDLQAPSGRLIIAVDGFDDPQQLRGVERMLQTITVD